jgi:hypothetical protein
MASRFPVGDALVRKSIPGSPCSKYFNTSQLGLSGKLSDKDRQSEFSPFVVTVWGVDAELSVTNCTGRSAKIPPDELDAIYYHQGAPALVAVSQ